MSTDERATETADQAKPTSGSPMSACTWCSADYGQLADRLRDMGWTCIPPVDPEAAIPEPALGQIWRSPKSGVEPRTVVKLAPHRWYPSGDICVYFTTPKGKSSSLHPVAWKSWARKSSARPEVKNDE